MDLTLVDITVADLTDSTGGSTFVVDGWTGSGSITADKAGDTISATKNANFYLTSNVLATSDNMSLKLVNLENATLTGGAAGEYVPSQKLGRRTEQRRRYAQPRSGRPQRGQRK